jgi:hypothetical protein
MDYAAQKYNFLRELPVGGNWNWSWNWSGVGYVGLI